MLSRRWLIFFVLVGLMAYGAWWLGQWQFDRLQQKHTANVQIQCNLKAAPQPITALLRVGELAPKASVVVASDPRCAALGPISPEWRQVTINGHWDDAHTLVLKYQTDDNGDPGVRVATPLITTTGAAVLIDRGWMSSQNNGDVRPSTPAPTKGLVNVTGWVRVNGTGDATDISDASTRALSAPVFSRWAENTYPGGVYGNFVELETQVPAPAVALGQVDMPDDTGDGPHFFYGLQWWFFGGLAVFGFFYLAYDERKRMRTGRMPITEKAPTDSE